MKLHVLLDKLGLMQRLQRLDLKQNRKLQMKNTMSIMALGLVEYTGVEKVNFFLWPQTEKGKNFFQNPKVPPTLRAHETSFTSRIPHYHLPFYFKKVKSTVLLKKCKKLKTLL